MDLLTQGRDGAARRELLSVLGIAASLIADQSPKDAPIVVTCDGPRTRIYCIFHDDAVDGSDASEDALGFDPLKGDWRISLPCPADDLSWVQNALAQNTTRITARDPAAAITNEGNEAASAMTLTLDPRGFIGS